MARKFQEDSIGEKIISYLGETLKGLFDLGITIAFDPHIFLEGGPFMEGSSRNLNQNITQLKRNGYFKEKEHKLYVTSKGRIKIIKSILENKENQKIRRKHWDGEWRGIIFDIPELSRRERNLLRRELKWIGFKELQKSIWVYPFDVEKELEVLLKLWKVDIEGDIRFILIKKIDDRDLKKEFNLK